MRVLIALSGPDATRLHEEAERDEHVVTRFEDDGTPDQLAARIRREIWDVVVADAHGDTLSMDVVDASDSRGVLLVVVVSDRESSENASACGVRESVSAWQSWADVVKVARSGDVAAESLSILEQTTARQRPLRILPDRHFPEERGHTFHESPESPQARAESAPLDAGQLASRVVTVWGPTGAPGRTTLAINLAAMAAKRGDRVVLIDADTFGGAVAIRCGVFDEAPGIARACRLAGAGTLTAAELLSLAHSVRVSNRSMDVVTGLLSSSRWPEISRDRLEKVIACARDNFDTVILDVGFSLETDEEVSSDMLAPRRNGATLAALQSATDVVAVSAADSVGLARFIRLWSDLSDLIPDIPITVAVNRVSARKEGAPASENIAAAFSRFAGIRDVVLIPESTDLVAKADTRGVPAWLLDEQSRFAAAIGELGQRALGIESPYARSRLREKMRGLRLLG